MSPLFPDHAPIRTRTRQTLGAVAALCLVWVLIVIGGLAAMAGLKGFVGGRW